MVHAWGLSQKRRKPWLPFSTSIMETEIFMPSNRPKDRAHRALPCSLASGSCVHHPTRQRHSKDMAGAQGESRGLARV